MDLLTREAVKEAIQNRNLIGRVEDGSYATRQRIRFYTRASTSHKRLGG